MKSAFHSPIQMMTTMLILVIVLSLGCAAVSIAYAAGRQSQVVTDVRG